MRQSRSGCPVEDRSQQEDVKGGHTSKYVSAVKGTPEPWPMIQSVKGRTGSPDLAMLASSASPPSAKYSPLCMGREGRGPSASTGEGLQPKDLERTNDDLPRVSRSDGIPLDHFDLARLLEFSDDGLERSPDRRERSNDAVVLENADAKPSTRSFPARNAGKGPVRGDRSPGDLNEPIERAKRSRRVSVRVLAQERGEGGCKDCT